MRQKCALKSGRDGADMPNSSSWQRKKKGVRLAQADALTGKRGAGLTSLHVGHKVAEVFGLLGKVGHSA